MTTLLWLAAGLLLVLGVLSAVATRVGGLEPMVRGGVVGAEALAVLVVVVDLGLVLRADAADRPGSMLTHLGYAIASVGLLPALVWRAPAAGGAEGVEGADGARQEPVSLWVVAVALAAVAVCLVRLAQTR